MTRLLKRVLTLLILLSSCASQNTTTEITPDAWRADLRYLARELPSQHINAFHTVSRETFAGEVARLDAAIPRMNGDEILVGFTRLVALIGDGHTHLDLPPSALRYPIELQWFGDELRVIAAQAPYHAAVGARVLAIGSTPIRDLMELATQLVPRAENEGRTRFTATMQFTSPEALRGLGVIANRENAPFALELATGERATITLSPARLGDFSAWRMATGEKPPLYLQRLLEPWWTEFLPNAQTVYFSFPRYPGDAEFQERTAALARLLDESHARRLVIDLRRNQGGDFDRFRRLLLPMITMNKASPSSSANTSNAFRAILWGGLLAGVLDLTAAIVTNGFRGIAPIRILQSIASGVLGAESYKGGLRTALLGTALHFVITFTAAAVYYAVSRKLTVLVRWAVVGGLIYGIAIYWFMNLIVLPLSAVPFKVTFGPTILVTGLIVHMLCVGLPIALAVRQFSNN